MKAKLAEVSIADLQLPDDIMHRSVDHLTSSIGELGVIQEPVVRESDKLLICGADRIAALLRLGEQRAQVKLVEVTDERVARMRVDENLRRRSMPPVDVVEETIEELAATMEDDPRQPGKRGRIKGAKRKAREVVASKLGVQEASLRRRIERRRKRGEPPPPPKEKKDAPPPIKCIGMEVDRSFLSHAASIQRAVASAADTIARATAALAPLEELPFPSPVLQTLRGKLRTLRVEVLGWRPTSLCPYCKGLGGVQDDCAACQTKGWLPACRENGVPERLWDEQAPMVQVAGHLKAIEDVTEPEEEAGVW